MTRILLTVTLAFLIACNQNPGQKANSQPIKSDTPALSSSRDTTTYDTLPNSAAKADEYYDKPPIKLPPTLAAFLPENFTVLDTASGDLNRDSLRDMILICRKKGEDSLDIEIPGQRPLLILTGQPYGSFKLAARNDNVVLCHNCGGTMGDPYQETVIKKGYFSLEFYGGAAERWSQIVTFKYVPADSSWYLHKISDDSFSAVEDNPKAKHHITSWSEKDLGAIPFTGFNTDSIRKTLTNK